MTAPADAGLQPVSGNAGVPQPVALGDSPQPHVPPSIGETPSTAETPSTGENLRGQPAGFASRFIAFIFDCVVSIGIFMLVLSAASFAASVLTGSSIRYSRGNTWVVIAFFAWEFFYYAYFWTASGKTPGMVLLGVQVIGEDGARAGTRRGLIRTLAFPLSFILLGLGFVSILFRRDRRALHDLIADTAVVYCWDAREARLRSLARQGNVHQDNAQGNARQGHGRQP
jgi:uncharacterized RDD family membrane protein YckC